MLKPLAWLSVLAVLALLGLSGCAAFNSYGATMPVVPQGAQLVLDEPVVCPDRPDRTLYLHVYDVNPATQALVAVIGPTDAQHTNGTPIIIIVQDDAGTPTIYVSIDGTNANKLTLAEFTTKYGDLGPKAACSIAATLQASI